MTSKWNPSLRPTHLCVASVQSGPTICLGRMETPRSTWRPPSAATEPASRARPVPATRCARQGQPALPAARPAPKSRCKAPSRDGSLGLGPSPGALRIGGWVRWRASRSVWSRSDLLHLPTLVPRMPADERPEPLSRFSPRKRFSSSRSRSSSCSSISSGSPAASPSVVIPHPSLLCLTGLPNGAEDTTRRRAFDRRRASPGTACHRCGRQVRSTSHPPDDPHRETNDV
jgi:hypothetical protein